MSVGMTVQPRTMAPKALQTESAAALQTGKVGIQESLQVAIDAQAAGGPTLGKALGVIQDLFKGIKENKFSANQQGGMFSPALSKKVAPFATPQSPAIAMAYEKRYSGMQFDASKTSSMRGGSTSVQFNDAMQALSSLLQMPKPTEINALTAQAKSGDLAAQGRLSMFNDAQSMAASGVPSDIASAMLKQKQLDFIQEAVNMISKIMAWAHKDASAIINNLK